MENPSPLLAALLRVVTATWACLAGAQASPAAAVLECGKVLMEVIDQARDDRGRVRRDKGLSGGMVFDEPPFRAVASNIRPVGGLIGPPMPFEFYRRLSDADLAAVVAYTRAQPAVSNAGPKSVHRIPLPPAYGPPVRSVAAPPAADLVGTGEHPARIGHCMDCHTPRSADGRLLMEQIGAGGMHFPGPWGFSVAPNLTPHDGVLKGWSDAEIARAIRKGVGRDGSRLKPSMAFGHYQTIGDTDMAALIAYLRWLKPLAFAGMN